jgi:carboxylesterase type B
MLYAIINDGLSLNIYRPDLRYGEKRKAIMLFSHGGSNQLGKMRNVIFEKNQFIYFD